MNNTFEISFPYDVQYDGEHRFSDTVKVKLTEKDILDAAELFRKNGGYTVDFCALEKIVEKVEEQIYAEELFDHFDEDCDFELLEVELSTEIPQELLDLIDLHIDTRDVNLGYYSSNGNKEVRSFKLVTIPKDSFKAMLSVVELGRNDKPDFELLEELHPDVYNQIQSLSPAGCELKEFPFEVYEAF